MKNSGGAPRDFAPNPLNLNKASSKIGSSYLNMIALWIILHSKRKYGFENAVANSESEQKPFSCLFAFVK